MEKRAAALAKVLPSIDERGCVFGGETMNEHPILCTGDEVRAIRAGRKTQTRRVIKPQPPVEATAVKATSIPCWWNPVIAKTGDAVFDVPVGMVFRCPFGGPGDKLKVRETFCIETNFDIGSHYQPPFTDGRPVRWIEDEDFGGKYWQQCHYRATDPTPELDIGGSEPGVRWCPSTNMPRWACRLVLDVTDVRVERASTAGVDDGGKSYAMGDWLWVSSFTTETS